MDLAFASRLLFGNANVPESSKGPFGPWFEFTFHKGHLEGPPVVHERCLRLVLHRPQGITFGELVFPEGRRAAGRA